MAQLSLNATDRATLEARTPWLWLNPGHLGVPADHPDLSAKVAEALDRFARSENLIRRFFDLPGRDSALISSALLASPELPEARGERVYLKADHALPVAGSIKARGGFHEIIAHAERLAIAHGLIGPGQDLTPLASAEARALFQQHSVVVGSTGNLGLSVGLCGAALGFRAIVHMSTDAKAWKKQRLRDHGATVVEHSGDYGKAVAQGRAQAAQDPKAHFIDDERSVDLFCGYACAAYELRDQLQARGIAVDADHPLAVYLPCGVGGAPGGIAYGLKLIFGADVFCFFAEPVESPCMLVQLLNGTPPASVYDLGLSNMTELDGLAVGAASPFVAPLMADRLAGIYTIKDATAFRFLRALHDTAGIKVEPSAATALAGLGFLVKIDPALARRATHIAWMTGGSLVPDAEFRQFLGKGA